MGTNYYLYMNRTDAQIEKDGYHIGKNSAGWVFQFEAYNRPLIKTVQAMRAFTKLGFIYDEYGRECTYEDFWQIVEESKEPYYGRDPYVLIDPDYPKEDISNSWEDEGLVFTEGEFC